MIKPKVGGKFFLVYVFFMAFHISCIEVWEQSLLFKLYLLF